MAEQTQQPDQNLSPGPSNDKRINPIPRQLGGIGGAGYVPVGLSLSQAICRELNRVRPQVQHLPRTTLTDATAYRHECTHLLLQPILQQMKDKIEGAGEDFGKWRTATKQYFLGELNRYQLSELIDEILDRAEGTRLHNIYVGCFTMAAGGF
jgi:hypothetical protein